MNNAPRRPKAQTSLQHQPYPVADSKLEGGQRDMSSMAVQQQQAATYRASLQLEDLPEPFPEDVAVGPPLRGADNKHLFSREVGGKQRGTDNAGRPLQDHQGSQDTTGGGDAFANRCEVAIARLAGPPIMLNLALAGEDLARRRLAEDEACLVHIPEIIAINVVKTASIAKPLQKRDENSLILGVGPPRLERARPNRRYPWTSLQEAVHPMLPELDAASRVPGVQQLLGQRGDVLPRWGEVSGGELLDRADKDLLVVRREKAAVGMGVSARETAPESMVEGGRGDGEVGGDLGDRAAVGLAANCSNSLFHRSAIKQDKNELKRAGFDCKIPS